MLAEKKNEAPKTEVAETKPEGTEGTEATDGDKKDGNFGYF